MPSYKIGFEGRLIGAIGIFEYFTEYVDAPTMESAKDKLYDKYEHIIVKSINQD